MIITGNFNHSYECWMVLPVSRQWDNLVRDLDDFFNTNALQLAFDSFWQKSNNLLDMIWVPAYIDAMLIRDSYLLEHNTLSDYTLI